MSIPHDYGDGRLHSRGNSRHYIEPDYIASEADDQLPLLSTVGRGPRGAGISIGNLVNEDGEFSFGIYSDLTGEQIMQTPNLSAGTIAVSAMPTEPVPGETVEMTVSVNQGSKISHYVVPIPAGTHGSRMFAVSTELDYGGKGHAYQVPIDSLMVYGLKREVWDSWPIPRVNDMCIFKAGTALGFGTIETVQDGMVTFTSQVMFDVLQHISIGENGNWVVDGVDTGVAARGPRGEQGPAGPPGEKGEKGDPDGLPARMTVGTVDEGDHPAFTVHLVDETTNTYSVNVTLPKGEDGKSININGGIYKLSDLPSFDDTPVNDAFIVNDYDESDDHRYDLYIRGKEPVIAEDGGPWTVVEDWQGIQGFSTRVLTGYSIDSDEAIRIPKAEADTAFTPHIGILDGDLCTDGKYLGVIGSAMDDSGDYTVTFVARFQIGWDDVLNKPKFLQFAKASDGILCFTGQNDMVSASQKYMPSEMGSPDRIVPGTTTYVDATAGSAQQIYIAIDTDRLAAKSKHGMLGDILTLSDSVIASLAKADTAIQETDLTEAIDAEAEARQQRDQALQTAINALPTTDDLSDAIAAEADAREKADQLLETEVDSKLDAADLVAGANVTITPDPESGHVTIAATGGGGGTGDLGPSSVTTDKIADGAVTAEKIAAGVIPDVSGFITGTAADGKYAAKSHTHLASQVTGLPASRALMSSSTGYPIVSEVTSTELEYLDGVTSAIQTQLDGKAATDHTHSTATTSAVGFMSAADKAKLDALPDSFTEPAVDIVRTTTHSTSYTKDTLEIVTDSTGKVTEMWFVTAD